MLLINYKPVLSQPTGIGVYANSVLPAFDQFEHTLIPGGGSGSGKERLKRLAWSQFQLPRLAREWKADLIFTPAPEGYLGEQVVPQVVMAHDLRPLSHPECSMQSIYFKCWVPKLLKQCKHILANSKFTSLEIQRAIGVSPDKISVTPLGYDASHFYPLDTHKKLHLRPYLLHIGQAYPHKNLNRLIQSFNLIAKHFPDVDLILLGKPHPSETRKLQQLVAELNLNERIIFKSYAPYSDLPDWYRGALAFVYPSLWEGFGLPILEAMACGCPVVTSFGSATQEVAQESTLLIDPYSIKELSKAMVRLLESQELRRDLTIGGLKVSCNYSWRDCAKKTSSCLTDLLEATP